MPSYTASNTQTNGFVVTGVFNTETNNITYTVSTPQGNTANITRPISAPVPTAALIDALRAIGQTGGITIGASLGQVKREAEFEASKADTAATATGTSPPDNPQPPPPVSPAEDPFEKSRQEAVKKQEEQGPNSQTVIDTETDPFEKARQEAAQKTTNEAPNEQVVVDAMVEDAAAQARAEAQAKLDAAGPTAQDVIDAEQDPFEKARMEAAQRSTDIAPSAQDVIDAEQDPFEKARLEKAQKEEVPVDQKEIDPNEDPFEASRLEAEQKLNRDELDREENPNRGTTAVQTALRTQATAQDEVNFKQFEDWRVRLSLAPQSNYLYNADTPGILQPLQATNGILFPYTPNISVQYAAHYDGTEVAHNNYKIYQYKNSSVDSISITCDFTAQDTFEANYLLAVIHFLRSVTKMFYGQDQNPKRGTPPPLCYLTGLGSFQFDAHPLAITNFTYNLPTDVDYIRAGTLTTLAGVNKANTNNPNNSTPSSNNRMVGIAPGGLKPAPQFKGTPGGTVEPTYVPTKMQIQIQAVPIVTRNDISNNFSLKSYATGELLKGMKGNKRISGGIW